MCKKKKTQCITDETVGHLQVKGTSDGFAFFSWSLSLLQSNNTTEDDIFLFI